MEDALVQVIKLLKEERFEVLILVLMEDALVRRRNADCRP